MALAKHLLNECLTSHCTMLQAAGFNSMSYEDFQEPFVNLLRLIAGDDPVVVESEGLRVMLAGDGENGQADDLTTLMTFNAIVVYLRFFCSAYLKCNRELYEAFVADVGGLDSYCERSIEAMDKYCAVLIIKLLLITLIGKQMNCA
jgi:hypothetical protein